MEPCFVYIIEGVGAAADGKDLFKVGMTANVESRLKAISTSSPFKLRLVAFRKLPHKGAARFVEGYLHSAMRLSRANGEWFRSHIIGAMCTLDDACMAYFMGTDAAPVHAGEGDFERLPDFLLQCGTPGDLVADVIQAEYGTLPLCLTEGTAH